MILSIITVNYNNKVGLLHTLRSLSSQTYQDYELIIIDGGSVDGSLEVIKEFSQSDIQQMHWVSEQDAGIYNAMNKGIALATGDYCYFLNSGEILCDDFVLENVFKNNCTESIIVGNSVMVLEDVVRVEKFNNVTFGSFFTGSICHQAAFIKRSLFHKYGTYNEQLKIVSDWKFFIETLVLKNETIKYVDVNIVYHDLYGISISSSELYAKERKEYLASSIPQYILTDYEQNWDDILQLQRLKNAKYVYRFVLLCFRITNKWNRVKLKIENRKSNKLFKSQMNRIS